MDNIEIIEKIKLQKLLPLFFNADKETCIRIVQTLYDAGITVIEFTNRGEEALENFKAIAAAKASRFPKLLLAAGTIKTAEKAKQFINAGADFLISPFFNKDVCEIATTQKKLWIPGCMTPAEIHIAESAGCIMIKLFPGNVLGPQFVSSVRDIFPELHFIITGGVEPEEGNLKSWFHSGAAAVGMGSKLINVSEIEQHNFDGLQIRLQKVLGLIKDI